MFEESHCIKLKLCSKLSSLDTMMLRTLQLLEHDDGWSQVARVGIEGWVRVGIEVNPAPVMSCRGHVSQLGWISFPGDPRNENTTTTNQELCDVRTRCTSCRLQIANSKIANQVGGVLTTAIEALRDPPFCNIWLVGISCTLVESRPQRQLWIVL